MHGDLQKGNLLLDWRDPVDPTGRPYWPRFVVIDWPGALIKGYAIYDLICLARSLNLTGWRLRAEIAHHCSLLGCDLVDTRSYLMAALGHIGAHLGRFPLSLFANDAQSCLKTLETVLVTVPSPSWHQSCRSRPANRQERMSVRWSPSSK